MTVADELYLLYQKSNDESKKCIKQWEENFDWLEEVLFSAREARGKFVIPKTPAAKKSKRKRKVSLPESEDFAKPLKLSAVEIKPKRKKARQTSKVESDLSTLEITQEEIVNKTPEKVEVEAKEPVIPRRTTRVKKPETPMKKIVCDEIPHNTCSPQSNKRKLLEDETKWEENIDEGDFCAKPFVEVITLVQTPKQHKLKSMVNTPKTPMTIKTATPIRSQTPRSCKPKSVHKENLNTINIPSEAYVSPYRGSPARKKHVLKDTTQDTLARKTTLKTAQIRTSLLAKSTMRSSLNKGSMFAKKGKAPSTPPVDCRSRGMQFKGLSSGNIYRQRPIFNSASPLAGNKMPTPSDIKRHVNLLSGVGGSLVSRVMPKQPTKEDLEQEKQVALQKRHDKQEESRKKKEELLKSQAEEKKRKNEERMRRAQEIRLNNEKEKKYKEESRLKLEKERRQRDEERLREEKDKRKKLQAAKAEEEVLKLVRIKARQEEEERQRQEQLHRDEEQRKLIEIKQKMEMQKRLLEQKKEAEKIAQEKYQLQKKFEANRIAKEKLEMTKLKAQPKPEVMDSTYTKSPPSNNYELTPVPLPKAIDPNNYDIDDRRSDDSTDEEEEPKKDIPEWAKGALLRTAIFNQEYYTNDVEDIFPARQLLRAPNLSDIFGKKRSRFFKRTSSAVWNTPPIGE